MGVLSATYYRGLPIVNRPASHYSIRIRLRGKALVQDEEQGGLLPTYKRQYLSVLGSFA